MNRLLGNGEVIDAETVDTSSLTREIDRLKKELQLARAMASDAQDQLNKALRAQKKLKQFLNPLHDALGEIFGELGSVQGETNNSNGPLESSRYDPWKQKFPGQTASAIDILVKYEAGLTRKQLAGFLKVEPGSGTMSQIIFKLNKADLIEKDGNTIRLRRF